MSPDRQEDALAQDRGSFEEEASPEPFVRVQRVVVRMLYDPVFVDRVYTDPDAALREETLPAALVRQLVANDRRLWNADRLRRRRALATLMEEFKASTALVLVAQGRLAVLDAFFSSAIFHRAVQRRRYLALAFAAFLEEVIGPRHPEARAVLAVEAGMARARRGAREARRGRDPGLRPLPGVRPGRRLVVGPGVGSAAVPGGTLDLVHHVERWLFQASLVPALSLCADAPRPEPLPRLDPDAQETWLFEPGPDARVELNGIEPAWHPVIGALARPRDRGELGRCLRSEGITEEKAWEMAEILVGAGVVRAVEVSADGTVLPC